jgi:hypothetical protein
MDAKRSSRRRVIGIFGLGSGVACSVLLTVLAWPQSPLTELESRCVGSWEFTSPDNSSTLIVYHFGKDRNVREEHYYLTSATPMVPRITMVGQWRVESDDRMVVERRGGLKGLGDSGSGLIRGVLNDDRRLARPVSTRFYRIDSATARGLSVRSGEANFVMRPFQGPRGLPVKRAGDWGR